MSIEPARHFINWQQDPESNYLARVVFPDETEQLRIEVDLIAEMAVLNPFDFFLEPHAESFPLAYTAEEQSALAPYLAKVAASPRFAEYLARFHLCPSIRRIFSSRSMGVWPGMCAI